MPIVEIQESEFELGYRRFKRACERAKVASTAREHEYYQKPSEKRKARHATAIKRHQKRLRKEHEALEREKVRR